MANAFYCGDKSGQVEIVDAPTCTHNNDLGAISDGTTLQITGMAWDPVGGTLYAVTTTNAPHLPKALFSVDPPSGVATHIGNLGTAKSMTDITCSPGGQLYGWLAGGGGLHSINKATGVAAAIGTANEFSGGLCFVGSTLYYLGFGIGNNIFTVNTATGVATDTGVTITGSPFGVEAAEYHEGVVYGGGANNYYAAIDLVTGVGTFIGSLEHFDLQALASVPIPPAPPPETPPPPTNVGPPTFEWRFAVTKLNLRVLSWLDRVATQRQVNYTLNKAAVSTGVVPSDNPAVNLVQSDGFRILDEGVRCLIGFRRESSAAPKWVPRFAGIIEQVEDNDDENGGVAPYSTYTAYDPRQLLYSRPVLLASGDLPGPAGVTFTSQTGNSIVQDLLDRSFTADGEHYIISPVDFEVTDVISKITFQQGASIGEALEQLVETGNCDIIFRAVYDPATYPNKLAQVSVYKLAGYDFDGTPNIKHKAPLAWDMPRRNLVGINRLKDGTQRANRIQYFGSKGTSVGVVSAFGEVANYGDYWAQQFFQGADPAAVELLAEEQLLIRKKGVKTYKVNPVPGSLGQIDSPIPFLDYELGTLLPVFASGRFRKKIAVAKRVISMPIVIRDDGVETVSQLEFGEGEEEVTVSGGGGGEGGGGGGEGGGGGGAEGGAPALPARMPASGGVVTDVSSVSELITAINNAAAGAVIRIRHGSYAGGSGTTAQLNIANKRLTTAAIAASGPITITNYPGESVTFTGGSVYTSNLSVWTNCQGIRIQGGNGGGEIVFDAHLTGVAWKVDTCQQMEIDRVIMRNMGIDAPRGGHPILVVSTSGHSQSYCDDVQIWNSIIHNWGEDTVSGIGGGHGIYIGSRGNQSTSVRGGVENGVIANCLVYTGSGYGVQLGDQARNCIVANNTIDGMTQSTHGVGSGIVVWSTGGTYGSQDNLVTNNLLTNTVAYAVQASGNSLSPSIVRNNLAYANALAPPAYQTYSYSAFTDGGNLASADPLYVNHAAHDFHLQGGSPAIGAGDPSYAPSFDLYGNPRSAADLGAVAA